MPPSLSKKSDTDGNIAQIVYSKFGLFLNMINPDFGPYL